MTGILIAGNTYYALSLSQYLDHLSCIDITLTFSKKQLKENSLMMEVTIDLEIFYIKITDITLFKMTLKYIFKLKGCTII